MADEERTVDPLSSGELFNTAVAPEPAAEPEAPAKPEVVETLPPVPPPTPEVEAAIPSWRLREEAEGRRLAEDRARTLEARLNEVAAHIRQNQKQPDFFEHPDQATQAIIQRTLQPILEEQRKNQMYLGKMVAEVAHGVDKVSTAETAFLKAKDNLSLDPADYERVVNSPNRYDAVVQWHKRQSVLSSVGDDPNAWFDKQLEAKMADPQFQAKMLERARAGAATKPGTVKLPPSLSKATAAAGNRDEPLGDMSDTSLFAYAMKR